MPTFCRQYEYCLKIVLEISQFAWLPVSIFRQTVYWFCASVVLLCACVRAYVRAWERGKLWLLCGTQLNMWPVLTKRVLTSGNLRYLHVSNLQVLLVILILKSRIYSNKCGCVVFLKVECVVEAIFRKISFKVFRAHQCKHTKVEWL